MVQGLKCRYIRMPSPRISSRITTAGMRRSHVPPPPRPVSRLRSSCDCRLVADACSTAACSESTASACSVVRRSRSCVERVPSSVALRSGGRRVYGSVGSEGSKCRVIRQPSAEVRAWLCSCPSREAWVCSASAASVLSLRSAWCRAERRDTVRQPASSRAARRSSRR